MVEELAALTGNAEGLLRVHLGDQLDAKALIGSYVATSVPGEFGWLPGPLTQVPLAQDQTLSFSSQQWRDGGMVLHFAGLSGVF